MMYFIILFSLFIWHIYKGCVLIKNGLDEKQVSKLPIYIKEEVEGIQNGKIDEKTLGQWYGIVFIIQSLYPLGLILGLHLRIGWILIVAISFHGIPIIVSDILLIFLLDKGRQDTVLHFN